MQTSSSPGFHVDFLSKSEAETYRFGSFLAHYVFPGLLILFSGDLGAGKTVLIRGIAETLSAENVRSPSFTLVNEYPGVIPVTHADLYRLSHGDHPFLELEEALEEGRLVMVEWAENWAHPPLEEAWVCRIELSEAPDSEGYRRIVIFPHGAKASLALQKAAGSISEREGVEPIDD